MSKLKKEQELIAEAKRVSTEQDRLFEEAKQRREQEAIQHLATLSAKEKGKIDKTPNKKSSRRFIQ